MFYLVIIIFLNIIFLFSQQKALRGTDTHLLFFFYGLYFEENFIWKTSILKTRTITYKDSFTSLWYVWDKEL